MVIATGDTSNLGSIGDQLTYKKTGHQHDSLIIITKSDGDLIVIRNETAKATQPMHFLSTMTSSQLPHL